MKNIYELNIPLTTLWFNEIDLTAVRNMDKPRVSFLLNIENHESISKFCSCKELKIYIDRLNDVEFGYRIEDAETHEEMIKLAGDTSLSAFEQSFLTLKTDACDTCPNMCLDDNKKLKFARTCNCLIMSDMIILIMNAIRDFMIYKYHLKPKQYMVDKKYYNPTLLYDNSRDDKIIRITYNKFPTFKDYMIGLADGKLSIAIIARMYMLIDSLFGISDLNVIGRVLSRLAYNTADNQFLSQFDKSITDKQAVENLCNLIKTLYDKKIIMGEFERLFLANLGKDYESNIKDYKPDEILKDVKSEEILDKPIQQAEEVKLDILDETVALEIIDEPAQEPEEDINFEFDNDWYITESVGEDIYTLHYIYPVKVDNVVKNKAGSRRLKFKSAKDAIKTLSALKSLIDGTQADDKKALQIYKSLSISRERKESEYDELLTLYDDEKKHDKQKISELEKENFELRQRLEYLTSQLNTKREQDLSINELWPGEQNHFLLQAAKQVRGQWEIATGDARRGLDVLDSFISNQGESDYPQYVFDEIYSVFSSNSSLELMQNRLGLINIECERGENSHYHIWPKDHPEYKCVLSSTAGDNRSYINGIKKFVQIMFK